MWIRVEAESGRWCGDEDTTLSGETSPFQERHKPQKVHQRAQRKYMDVAEALKTAEVLQVQIEASVKTQRPFRLQRI